MVTFSELLLSDQFQFVVCKLELIVVEDRKLSGLAVKPRKEKYQLFIIYVYTFLFCSEMDTYHTTPVNKTVSKPYTNKLIKLSFRETNHI